MRKCKFLLFLLPLFLTGCEKPSQDSTPLVTHVTIIGTMQDSPFRAEYSDPQKMDSILYYLRSLEAQGFPEQDPERILGDHFRITVTLSDGSRHIYRQRAHRFLSRDSHPWQKVDPKKAEHLSALLQSLR